MNVWIVRFLSGLGFLFLGALGLSHRASVLPPADFRGHPLAGPEGGLAVEVLGWLGVCSWLLLGIGLFFVIRPIHHGFKVGAIQQKIAEWIPEKKVEEEEPEATDD